MANALVTLAQAVNAERLLDRIETLAQISAGGPGVTRAGYSPEERAAVEQVVAWGREVGLDVAWDEFANCFLHLPGEDVAAPVAMAGSHLDTVPQGGCFDGPLGVLSALETLTVLAEAGRRPRRGMELAIWACEESVRFVQGRVGSQLFAGRLRPVDLIPNDPGFDVAAWIGEAAPRPRRPHRPIASYFELHIEQGRRLENEGVPIGVVTGIAGSSRVLVEVQGRADHSGATPMPLRADALCGAAEIVLEVERLGRAESPRTTVATVGRLDVQPNAVNVVPGSVRFICDVRSLDATSVDGVVAAIQAHASGVAARRSLRIGAERRSRTEPVVFPEPLVALIEGAARALDYPSIRLPSGAGHDGQSLWPEVPIAMVFVPSRDGQSHAPTEFTAPEACAAGARVLALAWLQAAHA